jgi:hypothetical protein
MPTRFVSCAGAFLAAFLMTILPFSESNAQFAVNPQIGLSASSLSSDPRDSEASARFGYQFGVLLRIGDRLHFQPGVFWQRSGTELKTRSEVDLTTIKDEVDLDALVVSAGLGYTLFDSKPIALRLTGALAGTAILNVQENLFGLDTDNFNVILLGMPVGVGVDLLGFLTADLSYEFGLTNVFDEFFGLEVDATNNVVRFNVGLLF